VYRNKDPPCFLLFEPPEGGKLILNSAEGALSRYLLAPKARVDTNK